MEVVKIIYTDEPEHIVVVPKSSLTGVNQIVNLFANDFNQKHGNVRVLDELLLKLERKDSFGSLQTLKDEDLQSIGLDVIYVSNFVPMDVLLNCGNFGCSKEFYERDNHDTACQFHVKNVIFHEGLKGWGCCKKRVTDFDQCLAIEGCAFGRHNPAEKKLAKPKEAITDNIVVAKSGDIEHYTDLKAAPRQPIPTVKTEKKAEKPKERVWEADTPDAADSIIVVGTPCTHNGCKVSFQDDSSRSETCYYHPGDAEFHEGSKGWICCKPRTLEFSEFLKIPGCFEGKHKFIPDTSKIKIKHDFYQSGNNVYVTFYSKNVKKPESMIKFSPNMIHVNITLANGTPYNQDLFLAKTIIPEQCKYEILSTKIAVTLRKATPEEWNHFNLADDSIIII
jgi:hypothetical protein